MRATAFGDAITSENVEEVMVVWKGGPSITKMFALLGNCLEATVNRDLL